jgi:hypothetical protein
MENNLLSPQQRENLMNTLSRRMARMDDEILLDMEVQTRHASTGSTQPVVVKRKDSAAVSAVPASPPPDSSKPAASVNRRAALAYGVAGLFALAATAAGYGWYDTDQAYGALSEKVHQMQPQETAPDLRAAAEKLSADLEDLAKLSRQLQQGKTSSEQIIENYQDDLGAGALETLANLKKATEWLEGMQHAPYMQEALDGLLAMIENKELKYFYDFIKAYHDQLPMISTYLHSIPTLIGFNHKAVNLLTPWLNQQRSLAAQVIDPLNKDVFTLIDQLAEKASSAQASYQTTMVAEILQLLDEQERMRTVAGG